MELILKTPPQGETLLSPAESRQQCPRLSHGTLIHHKLCHLSQTTPVKQRWGQTGFKHRDE